MAKEVLLIVDGNNLIHRAYHAVPPLNQSKTGLPTNAVFGFTSMLLHAFAANKPNYCGVAFDLKGPTFRHQMDVNYKANRSAPEDNLIPQFDMVKDVVKAFNIPIFEKEGFEADDILGTLASQAEKKGLTTLILSGDADALQLVTDNTFVISPKPGRSFADVLKYDADEVIKKFGVSPAFVSDYKALVGDSSDNYPGLPGIGPKNASALIQQFGGIESIYARLSDIKPPRVQKIFEDNEELAKHYKIIATIVKDVPVELNLEDVSLKHYSRSRAVEVLRKYEFASLINRLPSAISDERSGEEIKPITIGLPASTKPQINITDFDTLNKMVEDCKNSAYAVEPVVQGTNPLNCHLTGLAFSGREQAYYLPLGHMCFDALNQLSFEMCKPKLQELFSSANTLCSYNSNFLKTLLCNKGITFNGTTFDAMLAAHLLGANNIDLIPLILDRMGIEVPEYPVGSGIKQVSVASLDIDVVSPIAALKAVCVLRMAISMSDELRHQGMWSLFEKVEMPLVPILVEMQLNGVCVDRNAMNSLSQSFKADIGKLTERIYTLAGHEFNINSPKQLGEVLFDELKIDIGKSKRSTDAALLESIKDKHSIIPLILEYRSLFKLDSTYVSALPEMINPNTNRIHTSFNQARTSTGRLSSSDPNLQNIPVKTELGNEIRKCFVASEKCVLLSGDYSQIDLRSLAHLSQDEALMTMFREGKDVHTATAAKLYGVSEENVTKSMRRAAKTVNFGVVYGMSSFGLEQSTDLSRSESTEFIKTYFEGFPGVRDYLDRVKNQARERGFVESLLGRRRVIPGINSDNRNVRESSERMAINMPVQGTSADIIKMAMLRLDAKMKKQYLKSKLILQVHDELIFEVPEAEQWVMRKMVKEEMENALELSIPLLVDINVAVNWGEMK